MLCAWIGPLSEKLWPVEFLESFHCSISRVWINYAPELNLWEKRFEHLNFSRASVVQFRASWYIIRLNGSSEWKVMTIWISRELALFNFGGVDILCAWIGPPSDKLWPFDFLDSFRSSISGVSIYDAPESDLRVKSNDHLNFSRACITQFRGLDILCALIGALSEKLWPFEFPESFHCSISRVWIYYAPELDLGVKSFDHLNFSRASVVQFRASW